MLSCQERVLSHRSASTGPSSWQHGSTSIQPCHQQVIVPTRTASCAPQRRSDVRVSNDVASTSSLKRWRHRQTWPVISNDSPERVAALLSPADTCAVEPGTVVTQFIAETLLPTRHGKFRLRGYKHSIDGGLTYTEPTAILVGDVAGREDVPVRVHDACFTSEVLGSLKCDCAEQLQLALHHIQQHPPGLLIYLQQEGRGIGLANKIAAYALQEKGLDTVDANRALGLPDDCREYSPVKNILDDLEVKSIHLMTNNPRKMTELSALGIRIAARLPCRVQAGKLSAQYLEAKRDRMDHLLDGDWCYWNHDGEPSPASPVSLSVGGMGLPVKSIDDALAPTLTAPPPADL